MTVRSQKNLQKNRAFVSMFKPYISNHAIRLANQTLRSGWIGEGPKVIAFEKAIGKKIQNKYTIALNSGTSALHLSLLVAGVTKDDEVITSAQTMLATTQAILAVGAHPVYADVQYLTGIIDPSDIEKRITKRTKAILTVDWSGYPCDYHEILAIAKKHRLVVIEDAAQALGATYMGKPVGCICPITCFSFQAIKTLTVGDGGMMVVKNIKWYRKGKRLRWFGIDRQHRKPSILGEPIWNVTELGYKYHMNDIAASIGLGNIINFNQLFARRKEIAEIYRTALKNVKGVHLFESKMSRESANWLFSLHVDKRNKFCRMMRSRGVEVSVVHMRIDRNKICGGQRNDLPNLSRFTDTHISIPLHNHMTDSDVTYVIRSIQRGW